MGDINRALGGGSELEFEGTVYQLSPWNYKIQAEYERYLERQAFDSLKKLKPLLSAEDYQEQLSRLQKDIAVGEYSFGSVLVAKSFYALPHFKHLVYLMILQNHKDVPKETVGLMVDKLYEDVLARVSQANEDPTASETSTELKS